MNQPAISIIIPIFNQHNYLAQCMDSVVTQSLKDIEIICVNDGSTDDSLKIIRGYADKDGRIKVIDKPNTGYGDSLNKGLEKATGEYIGIVEPDDFIDVYMMEYLYDKAKKNDLDWIRGDVNFYYNNGKNEKRVRESITLGMEIYDIVLDPRTDIRPHRTAVRTWAGIYKTIFIKANKIKCNPTPGAAYQDVGFYLQTLYYARRVMFVNTAFYNWRQDNPNSSINYDGMKALEMTDREYELDEKFLEGHPELCRNATGSFYYRKFQSYSFISLKLKGQEKRDLLVRLRREFFNVRMDRKVNSRFFTNIEWLFFKSLTINVTLYTVIGLFFAGYNDAKTHGVRHSFRLGISWMKNFLNRH